MHALRTGDSLVVLELIATALQRATPDFPDATVTGPLRELFQAEFAGAGRIDLRGTASRRWADSPRPLTGMKDDDFHKQAVSHPIARAHAHTGDPTPLRLSDVDDAPQRSPQLGGMTRVMTIPLRITAQDLCGIALMRRGPDFSILDLRLACGLQHVFGAIYALRDHVGDWSAAANDPDSGVSLSFRELAVLDLMAEGLIAAAIAHRLGISPRTVSRHMESIYHKLGTNDRTSTVLRGQRLGLLTRKGASHA